VGFCRDAVFRFPKHGIFFVRNGHHDTFSAWKIPEVLEKADK